MNYVSERDIQDIVARVLSQQGLGCGAKSSSCGQEIPVEISARHVHLDEAALEVLFGKVKDATGVAETHVSVPSALKLPDGLSRPWEADEPSLLFLPGQFLSIQKKTPLPPSAAAPFLCYLSQQK